MQNWKEKITIPNVMFLREKIVIFHDKILNNSENESLYCKMFLHI